MNIPITPFRKRFEKNGDLIQQVKPHIYTHPRDYSSVLDDICTLPLGQIGKMLRNSGEAKVIYDCKIQAELLKHVVKLILVTRLNIQFHNHESKIALLNPHSVGLYSIQVGARLELKNSLDRLESRMKLILDKLTNVKIELNRYSQINEGIYSELSVDGITPIALDKKKLAQLESLLVNRIDYVTMACPIDYPLNHTGYNEIFETKRQRSSQ